MRSFRLLSPRLSSSTSLRTALPVTLALGAYCLALLLCFERYVKAGVPLFLVATFAIALAPAAVYASLRWPLVFPFCLYVLFMPFDSLSSLGKAGSFTKMLGIVSAGAIFLSVLRRGNSVPAPRALAAWLALLCLMGVSILWSIEKSSATKELQVYGSLIALYALLSIVRVRKIDFNAILTCIVLAGVISGGYDAYLYRNGQDTINAGAGVSRVIVAVGNSMIDPNELAAALVLPFAICLYWLFNSRHWLLRVTMLPALTILLLGFAASGSRGGFMELAAVFAYLLVRSRHRIWLATIMVVSVVSALVANPGIPARFAQTQQDGGAGRSDVWHIGLYAFRDHWLIGAGVGNFPEAFNREYIHVFARYVLGWDWVAHNVPLTIATELGIFGLAIYALAVVTQLTVLRGFWTDTPLFELRLAIEGACIGMFVAGLSTSTLNAKFVWLAFALMPLMRSYQLTNMARERPGVSLRRSRGSMPWIARSRSPLPEGS